jgi:hypothetical protein
MKMLELESEGKPYNKAETNRQLRNGPLSSRNHQSVEFRMCNISSVLDEKGREYIAGYKPRGNVGAGVGDQIAALIEQYDKGSSSSTSTSISTTKFREAFESFKRKVGRDGKTFVSFSEGLPYEEEGYKLVVRTEALEMLATDSWSTEDVGSERILEAVIRAIEVEKNNLVHWKNKWGHRNRSHYKLLDARDYFDKKLQLEKLLFGLYVGKANEQDVFEGLRALAGVRYDLLAYLFFLKDCDRFMPIGVTAFDRAFKRLGVDLITSKQCSWENYCRYNESLTGVQQQLTHIGGVADARLIDAHSFCWMLGRLPEGSNPDSQSKGRNRGRDKGKSLSPMERSVYEMVHNARAAVGQSGGQQLRQVKNKEFRFKSNLEAEVYIHRLIEQQENKCALTGIPLKGREEESDDQLLPSLDRIDSEGHYEEENLQVVCRRLLELVRSSGNGVPQDGDAATTLFGKERLANLQRLGRRVKAGKATWLDCPGCGHEECHGCEGDGPLDAKGNPLSRDTERG